MPAQTRSRVVVRGKAALRSSFELEDAAAASSVDLYFGPIPLAKGARRIKATPGGGWVRLHRLLRARAGRVRQELETGRFRSNVFCRPALP
jgi:hypothetical protein